MTCYLLLEVVVSKVEDLHGSIGPGHGQPLTPAVERHGSDGTGHVVEEADTVNLKLTHCHWGGRHTHTDRLAVMDEL